MSVLPMVKYGNPLLKRKMSPVKDFRTLSDVVENMFDTMYEEEGIGLAANQVGVDLNLMVIDITHVASSDEPSNPGEFNRPLVFINGEILKGWGESTMEEGCLSLPGIRVDVKRFDMVHFAFQALHYSGEQEVSGERHVEEFRGLLARVIQHEMDHLNGLVILDRASPLTRQRFSQQLKQIASQ